ncbi:hypothetical protein CN221_11110 [Sinorhizobium meliloti]|uniref:hypothetical protein n=1 Tax=Sinorhizobium TaxID=28105 RepID=UPI000B49B6BC|nr:MULTISPECIES: hypothetical protein [Sinorhizobium]ASP84761.1 hypothetical protein CDO26_09245 [Sinorhizobium meliloti]MQW00730.1 hypothetical protein [Sinorhizobium medicae]MQW30463.1 hypothetical protein [Sinorhizobium meliloti]RVG96692.1 hypothetical protein CN221_11110 [Sinorhizobium meliloti]RVH69401.1 hypothetical protein CN209_02830 [Sinorhizobium meliloti]
MLPNDPEAVRAAFLRWTRGDEAAADFLAEIAAIARLADDIVDEEENRQRNVCWLLVRTLTRLPQNPFFNRHLAVLAPVIHSVIVQWELSDEWRSSHDALKRQFGFVMREAVGSIVTAVAAICGGYDHAKTTTEDFFELCHAGSRETVEDWMKD